MSIFSNATGKVFMAGSGFEYITGGWDGVGVRDARGQMHRSSKLQHT